MNNDQTNNSSAIAPTSRGSEHETNTTSEATAPAKGGEGGEGGVSNEEFVQSIFRIVPPKARPVICTKAGDPTTGGWTASSASRVRELSGRSNNYLGCSSFLPQADGSVRARKDGFAACHFLLIDDIGVKVDRDRLQALPLTWLLETSPGNFQGGIVFAEPLQDMVKATQLHNAIIEAGLCDPGARGPAHRWARLPVGINGKPKHRTGGSPFQCRLTEWNPERRYTPDEVAQQLGLNLATRPSSAAKAAAARHPLHVDIFTPRSQENLVLTALKQQGLYKRPLGGGKHDVTCPWVGEHTDARDGGSTYFEPDAAHLRGGFCCLHSHGDRYRLKQLLDFLGVDPAEARHRAVIRAVTGELSRVVDAAEMLLAETGRYYQSGERIVTIETDHLLGDPHLVAATVPSLTRDLSELALWETFDKRTGAWVPADPPTRHVTALHGAAHRHLPVLEGTTRQPFFREQDGELVLKPGYDERSKRFGVFDPKAFVLREATIESAKACLCELEALLTEFRFVGDTDKAAAMSAIFTAVVRPTLPRAPAFHVRAPAMGSGKSYLCDLVGAFAGPAPNAKVSYPTTAEEASKMILSLLLQGPAVIDFDDMASDWTPHGAINRALTSDRIEDRILGSSKTASAGTRVLFLGSGNNVGPVRDLLRRVITIHIDARVATPATLAYQGSPLERVRKHRGKFVGHVLTILQAWKAAGSPRAKVDSIASYGGAWSEYCRDALIWLGYPDPASSLIDQVRHDPDTDALKELLRAWHDAFGTTATTLRKAVTQVEEGFLPDLEDAIREFPVVDKQIINRNKLGWMLRKNANRIVDGREFRQAQADGRPAWQVVQVPVSPTSPAFQPKRLAVSAQVEGSASGVLDNEDLASWVPPLANDELRSSPPAEDSSALVEAPGPDSEVDDDFGFLSQPLPTTTGVELR